MKKPKILHGKLLTEEYYPPGSYGLSYIKWGGDIIFKAHEVMLRDVANFLVMYNINPTGLNQDQIKNQFLEKQENEEKHLMQMIEKICNEFTYIERKILVSVIGKYGPRAWLCSMLLKEDE